MISKKDFLTPSAIFRGAPFWSWNDKLEARELIRQIRDFKKRGIGGFFMHSRVGLITPYMGKEWMELIKVSVKEAKKLGMYAYLYDEDRWPSGFAGGFVPERDPELRQKSIVCLKTKEDVPGLNFLYGYKFKNENYYYYTRITPSNNPGFNGASYVDLLNPKTTDAFIDTTYEAYKKVVGKEFGRTVPAIFTDEPTFGLVSWVKGGEDYFSNFPWTDKFFGYFKKVNGYRIEDKLHFLNFKLKGYEKIRHDFWKAATGIFVENFAKRVGSWCEKNGINFTGHFLHEDTFNSQIHFIGAAMPHYEYMQWPGIDHLAGIVDKVKGCFWVHGTVKQCTSVAHQFEKERVMSELYGVGGWDLTFEDQKWIGDWEYVLGVNFRCQHLSLYTLKGCRKRDFPQAISYQQRWWKYYNMVEDYFGRLSYIMTRGKFTADVLVLHPVSSAWCLFDANNYEPTKKLHDKFLDLSMWLSELHHDFDYGDEIIMKKHGKIAGGKFVINKMSYKTVVIPPSLSWFKSTVDLVAKFLKAGGRVVVIKPLPVMLEGVESRELAGLFKHKNVTVAEHGKAALEKALKEVLPRDVSIKDPEGREAPSIYCQHRIDGKQHIYFFVNIDKNKAVDAEISLGRTGRTELWDPETGASKEITSLNLKFAPAQSHLIILDEEKQPSYKAGEEQGRLTGEFKLGGKWENRRLDHNALTLDLCRYKIMEEPWSKTVPVWKAQLNIRKAFGIKEAEELRVNDGTQFWKLYRNMSVSWRSNVALKYNFTVKAVPKKIFIAMEIPGRMEILVNNRKVKYVKGKNDWWVDLEFKKLDITKFVKKGVNEIRLNFLHRADIELESIYIIGDFGVYSRDKEHYFIGKEQKTLVRGDWGRQGYPFFGGEMVYKQFVELKKKPGERLFLELEKLNAVVAKVSVNGKAAGKLGWQPFSVDITSLAKDGKNLIEIELVSSLRNLLGPHHVKAGITYWASAHYFQDEADWTPKYNLVPYGILADIKVKRVAAR